MPRLDLPSACEHRGRIAALLLAAASGCDGGPPADPGPACADAPRGPAAGLFVEVSNQLAGRPLSAVEGGAVIADLDGDRDLDIVSYGLLAPVALHQNEGALRFADATVRSGLDPALSASAGARADLDRDGDPDLILATAEGLRIYENAGDASFVERGGGGIAGVDWSTGNIAPIDLDGDGLVDLHLTITGEQPADRLLLNAGDFVLIDVTEAAGLTEQGLGWTAAVHDFDGDGDADLHVANDTFVEDTGLEPLPAVEFPVDALLRNDSDPSGIRMTDVTAALGLDEPHSSMGALVADFDEDGRLDLYISNLGRNKLYLRQAGGGFREAAEELGVAVTRRRGPACDADSGRTECLLVSWGAALADFDLDGRTELIVVHGHIEGRQAQPAVMFDRDAHGRFIEVDPELACTGARALLPADLDGDGDLDLLATGNDGPLRLYENRTVRGGGWLRLRLRGDRSNAGAIGAVVHARLGDGRPLVRAVGAGGVVHTGLPLVVHLGLGDASLESLEITWPSGAVQSLIDVTTETLIPVDEPPL